MNFATLSRQTSKLVDEHIKNNALFRLYRYGRLRRCIQWVGDAPLVFVGLVVCFYTALFALFDLFLFDFYIPDIATDADSLLGGLNLVLMASQAAIFGMVYPMVIALVSIWVGRQRLGGNLFDCYLSDAHIKPLGVSGLSLLFVLVAKSLYLDHAFAEAYLFSTIVSAIWFTVNLAGTGHFLLVTRNYLRSTSHLAAMKRYAANVAWKEEFTVRIKQGVWAASTHPAYDLLPDPTPHNVQIALGPTFGGEGTPVIKRMFNHGVVFSDVRFWILRRIVERWMKRASNSEKSDVWSQPTFAVPIQPDVHLTNERESSLETTVVALRTAESKMDLTWIERLILPMAFKFRHTSKPELGSGAASILIGYASATAKALQINNHDEFEQLWSELVAYHAFLLNLSREKDEKTAYENLAEKLTDRPTFSSKALSYDWAQLYVDLFRAGFVKIDEDDWYFRRFCYGTSNLIGRIIDHSPASIVSQIFMLHSNLHYQLGKHWEQTVAREGISKLSSTVGHRLTGHEAKLYTGQCRQLIAAWESVYGQLPRPSGTDRADRRNYVIDIPLAQSFLMQTAKMIGQSVGIGDVENAEWMTDSLMRLLHTMQMRSMPTDRLSYGLLPEMITSFSVTDEEQFEAWRDRFLEQQQGALHQFDLRASMRTRALMNLHKDTALALCLTLTAWNFDNDRREVSRGRPNPSRDIVKNILDGNGKDETGRVHDLPNYFTSPPNIFICFLRILVSGHTYQGDSYRWLLNETVTLVERVNEKPMVSGRIYSSNGPNDLLSNLGSILVLLLVTWPDEAEPELLPNGWQDCFEGNNSNRMHDFVKNLREFLEKEREAIGPVYEDLTGKSLADDKVLQLSEALTRIETDQQRHLTDVIANAEISDARRLEFIANIGNKILTTDVERFPIKAFDQVDHSNRPDFDWYDGRLNLHGFEKGRLTDQRLADGGFNEAEFFGVALLDAVAQQAMWTILDLCEPVESGANSLEALSESLLGNLGDLINPVLLLPRQPPEWLSRWIYSWANDVSFPSLEFLRERDDADPNYMGKLVHPKTGKLISVRVMDFAAEAMIFDAGGLKELFFFEHDSGALFDIDFAIDEADSTRGVLTFNWKYRLIVKSLVLTTISLQ